MRVATKHLLVLIPLVTAGQMEGQSPTPLSGVRADVRVVENPGGVLQYQYEVRNPPSNLIRVSWVAVDVTLFTGDQDVRNDAVPADTTRFLDPYAVMAGGGQRPAESLREAVRAGFVRTGMFLPDSWGKAELVASRSPSSVLRGVVAARWGRTPFAHDASIQPGEAQAGFILTSYGLPTIRAGFAGADTDELEKTGRIPSDWYADEDEDDEDAIQRKSRLWDSLDQRFTTIGPGGIPAGLIPAEFARRIRGYVDESVRLGWLSSATLADRLRGTLDEIVVALGAERYADASGLLSRLQTEVRASTGAERTPEVEALVAFNAEWLRRRVISWIPQAFAVEPGELRHTLGEMAVFTVSARQGPNPIIGWYLEACVREGPHKGLAFSGTTDSQGRWVFGWPGRLLGRDEVVVKAQFFGEAFVQRAGPRPLGILLDEIGVVRVEWVGGPDLTLDHLWPPAMKIPSPLPYIELDETTVNVGSSPAPASKTVFYLSLDRTVDAGDVELRERAVPSLGPGEASAFRERIVPPTGLPAGVYWLLACADGRGEVAETDETNNCRTLRVDVVAVVDEGSNRPPDCSAARIVPDVLWPANHKMRPARIEGITDPDGDPVAVTVLSVTQDEPVEGLGDGDESPDATLSPLALRAERSGTGNGRVYRVAFEASDGRGGNCRGTLNVCVPRDQGAQAACVDDGEIWVSTTR